MKSVNLASSLNRTILLVSCTVLVVLMLLFAKWAFGHAVAINAVDIEVAALGRDLTVNDPHAHFGLAQHLGKTLLPGDDQKAMREYETAVSLSPSNYGFWLALGRAREQAGDSAGSEQALRNAKMLAPSYARVRWALGNALLRQNRLEEGFAEIREAAAADGSFANPAAAAAWQIFDGNVDAIRGTIGDSPQINASIAVLLATDKRYKEAADFWSRVPRDTTAAEMKKAGEALHNKFVEAGLYRSALETAASAGLFPESSAEVGTFVNGGFESAILPKSGSLFSWTVADGPFPAVGLNDSQKHSGAYSLLVRFGQGGKGFRTISQKIAVEPAGGYEIQFFYRSELTTAARLRCDVFSAAGAVIAGAPLAGKQEWGEIRVPFTVPGDVEGIEVRINIEDCPAGVCMVSGNIWFDDFSLIKR